MFCSGTFYKKKKTTKNECMLSTYCLKSNAAKFNGSKKVKLAESVPCILEVCDSSH